MSDDQQRRKPHPNSLFSNAPDDQLQASEEEVIGLAGGVVFVCGKRLYGVVEGVPDVFHVATFFYHFAYLPSIPVESWVFVTDECGYDGIRDVPIGLNLQSVSLGWLRAFTLVFGSLAALICLALLLATLSRQGSPTYLAVSMIAVVSAFGLYWLLGKVSFLSQPKPNSWPPKPAFRPKRATRSWIMPTWRRVMRTVNRLSSRVLPAAGSCPSARASVLAAKVNSVRAKHWRRAANHVRTQ